ncbi:pyrroloquinoline quinone biosynthesis protein PqqB [Ramlibacter sp. G-1-2-2]|uniref:Coenzyme PQQ synthesis protein B n=1 Tax=Ramlibacter agri TaxID=2728837 RepID=A0A848H6U4_9BURK|nr:pyrroloquinoline quinone biosynthesis protein PqqB [Ramlibacter agri]NML45602.1 pyrroloquinoline quinone biosynthesis protein PqqB [Ramlibacter agri]
MRITILGSAAGGGFPQWNCNCRNCAGVRGGTVRAKPRTQSSIFVRADAGVDGILFNASPDILEQIRARPALQPGRKVRDTAIAGVVLVDGQVDHATGLLMLRERGSPLPIWCTEAVAADLRQGLPLFEVLRHYCGVESHGVSPDGPGFELPGVPGIVLRALALAGKAAPYSPHRQQGTPGDNIAVVIADRQRGTSAFYAPGLMEISPPVFDAMCTADAVLVDGTFWTDDEMIRLGLSRHRARDIGHLALSGNGGMLDWLARLPSPTRRFLIHVNNTNPILDEDSPERAALAAAGVTVCEDGMEIVL